jgi:hypothetical protein
LSYNIARLFKLKFKQIKKGGPMKFLYNKQAVAILTVIALTGSACGQNAKVKTITIVNGDTTISEKELGDKEIAEIEKQITMVINEDGDSSGKKVIKKIIINGDDKKECDAMAFAYSIGEEKGDDVEIITDDNGKETKIIVKNGSDEKGERREKKTVISRSTNSTDDKKGKESMNLNINVSRNLAKVEVETSSKEPLNISILDENGKQVFYETQKGGGKYSEEIKLEKGTYFLNLIQNKKSTTDKIVIQ